MKIVLENGTEFSVKVEQICTGHISVDDIVLMVETSFNKIESIEWIIFESSYDSMTLPHSRQSHQNFITRLRGVGPGSSSKFSRN